MQHHLRLQSEHSYSDLSHIISSGKHCFLFTYMVSWRYQHRFGELKCPGATLMVVLSIKKTCCVVLSMLMPFKTQPERNMCTVLRTIIQWPLIVIEVRHQNKLGLIFVLKKSIKETCHLYAIIKLQWFGTKRHWFGGACRAASWYCWGLTSCCCFERNKGELID